MPQANPPPTLTIALGFAGTLRIVYPSGQSLSLPQGEVEERLIEIFEGFRRELKDIRQSLGKVSDRAPIAFLSLADLGIEEEASPPPGPALAATPPLSPPFPDRTAMRLLGQKQEYRIWPSRAAMVKTLREEETRPATHLNWIAVQPMQDEEG